jgi:penicillin-binding protein 1C
MSSTGIKPRLRATLKLAAALLLVPAVCWAGLKVAVWSMGAPDLATAKEVSRSVLDRDDRLLRAFTTADGRWRLPVEVKDVEPRYVAMLLAYEDKRFRSHGGVDPVAIVRAVGLLARHGRIMSGASTLTMQVARLVKGHHARTGFGKLAQMVHALQLERHLSKNDILTLYLRLAPFGGNVEGVRAASLAYFGKEPRRLSIGEAALLVALPQSPELRRPDRNPAAARRARNRVLDRVARTHVISKAEAERAKQEPVPQVRREFPKLAPHLAEAEVKRDEGVQVHRTTLDRDLQASLEELAREHAHAAGAKLSAGVMVVDHTTGEVLSYVGSAGYLDDSRFGSIDMVKAVRSPGSTLKPIIYGLGFEQGLIHPETLIEDRPVRFGSYAPRNFDDDFHGTVTIRDALGHSLNIPAVKVLNAIGPARLVSRFRRIRMVTALPSKSQPTLAIALGGIGLRLQDLAMLYASLAQGGEPVHLKLRRDANSKAAPGAEGASAAPGAAASPFHRRMARGEARRLLSPVAAWYVTDVLKDAPPPANAKGGRIAYKTGTSYGYRDSWAIGYDGRHTIAVWVGRPDAAATPGLTGRTAAAPLLFDAFQRLGEKRATLPPAPRGVLRVASGAELPPPLKRFREGGEDPNAAGGFLDMPVAISFPPDRSELEVERGDPDPVVLKADGGALPLTWLVDGAPIASDPHKRDVAWRPDGLGFVKLSVIDAKGRTDRVIVRLR